MGEEIQMRKLARENHLIISGGSDYHGANKPNLEIGIGRGRLAVPYDVLSEIRNIHEKEYNWNKLSTKPEEVEKYKLEIAEVCMKHGLNPVQIGLFGEHDKAGPYQYEDETGAIVSMTKHRLNPIFYTEEFYAKGFHSIAEAIHEEGFEIFI
jgi:hypothetical protein